jgi:zinc protease
MKALRVAFAALVALWYGTAAAAAIDIKEVTTPLGIKAWLVEDKSTPVVALSFSFAGGSASEPEAQRGITSLAAEMLTDGAGSYNALAFRQRMEEVSVSFGFGASLDRLNGSMRALSANLGDSIELLRLAMMQPRFDADQLAQRRAQTISGLSQAQQRPGSVAERALMNAMFPDYPYAADPFGSRETLQTITPADLKKRAAALLTRAGLLVAAVGDVSEAELARQIDRAFGDLPAGEPRSALPNWTPPARGRSLMIERPVPQSTVLLAMPGLMRDDRDWYAYFVMNHILGGGMQSRLFTEVREKRGLAYSVSSSPRVYRTAALFRISTASATERTPEAIRVIRSELARLRSEGVTDQELAEAKTYLTGSLALSLDSSGSIAGLLHGMQIDGLPRDHLDKRAALIAAVRTEDVQRVAQRVLRDDQITTVVVGRSKVKAAPATQD